MFKNTKGGSRCHLADRAEIIGPVGVYQECCALAVALAACSAAIYAGERHNIVLLVPEVLSAASADDGHAPTLNRLRDDGVNFMESHSSFPPLAPHGLEIAAYFNKDVLVEAAAALGYTVTYLQDADLDSFVVPALRSFSKSQPFLAVDSGHPSAFSHVPIVITQLPWTFRFTPSMVFWRSQVIDATHTGCYHLRGVRYGSSYSDTSVRSGSVAALEGWRELYAHRESARHGQSDAGSCRRKPREVSRRELDVVRVWH